MHRFQDLIQLFEDCFFASHSTRLVAGDEEPLYLPADEQMPYHRVIFAHGYFASALHEIAHWCIAGTERRQQVDYGYWYQPDGRDSCQQALFEAVEAKPQALEWAFSLACGAPFRVSLDNLNGAKSDPKQFEQRVWRQLLDYHQRGFPHRAKRFIETLQEFYRQPPLSTRDVQQLMGASR